MKKLLSILFATLLSLNLLGEDGLLLWQFMDLTWNDDIGDIEQTMITEVHGRDPVTISELIGRGPEADGKRVNGMRVKMIGAPGGDVYLGSFLQDGGSPEDAVYTLGVPNTGVFEGETYEVWDVGPAYARIGNIDDLPASVSFMIELGNYDAGTDNWLVLATSQQSTYSELLNAGHIFNNEMDMQTIVPWSGGQYTVPEPTSGILILIGGGLLALRRKRK